MTDFCVSFKIVSCLLLNAEETWLGWVGLGWVGIGWVGIGWVGLGSVELGWVGLGSVGLGWVGIGWVGLGWVGLGWVWFGSVRKKDDSTHGKPHPDDRGTKGRTTSGFLSTLIGLPK